MGKIYVIIGKSASGKDTIYSRLLSNEALSLLPYVIYTTRPKRDGEKEGVEYYFTDEIEMNALENAGKIIEKRAYDTVYGKWYYFTAVRDDINPEANDYIYIGTLESYVKMRDYYGEDKVTSLYIEIEDGERLRRAISREGTRRVPQYEEMCRRFLADQEDFSEEKILEAGITKRFDNFSGDSCLENIVKEILKK